MVSPLSSEDIEGTPGRLGTVVGGTVAIQLSLPRATIGPPTGSVVTTASRCPPAASAIIGAPPL
jgi:hypothetical protein